MKRLTADQSMATFARLFKERGGLRALLQKLPPGATLAEASRLHEKLKQAGRAPCTFLDRGTDTNRG